MSSWNSVLVYIQEYDIYMYIYGKMICKVSKIFVYSLQSDILKSMYHT